MVDIVLKLLSPEISVTTANTVADSNLFRVYAPSTAIVTVTNANDEVVGSMTIPGGFVEVIAKDFDDTVSANVAVLCTPLAWR